MPFELIDDGTLDTVFHCPACGSSERFTFDASACGLCDEEAAECAHYDDFLEDCIEELGDSHECVFTLQVGRSYTLADIPESHRDALTACYHSGRCDADVEAARPLFAIDDAEGLRRHLAEYGAWDAEELADDAANLGRLLWFMAGDIQDRGEAYIGT